MLQNAFYVMQNVKLKTSQNDSGEMKGTIDYVYENDQSFQVLNDKEIICEIMKRN